MSKQSSVTIFFIKGFIENLEKDIKGQKIKLEKCKEGHSYFYEIPSLEKIIDDYELIRVEISSCSELNQFISLLPYISKDFLYSKDWQGRSILKVSLYNNEINKALSILEIIERRCHALLTSLEVLLKPEVPLKVTTQLGLLKEELEKIKDELKTEVYIDIKEAISEMEQGHNLAATMIASRVIRYVLDKIKILGENDEKKVNKLLELKIIEKERKDELQRFMNASKLSRDILSHRAGFRLEPEEALQLVSSAVIFAKYLVKILKIMK